MENTKQKEAKKKLMELIIETRDLNLFKSFSLSNGLMKLLGRHFNSADTRTFIGNVSRHDKNISIKNDNKIIELKPEDFHRTENKTLPNLEEKVKEIVKEVPVNEEKEIHKMLAKELRKYFGSVGMAVEYINGERIDIGLELIGVKKYQWGELKKFIAENIVHKQNLANGGIKDKANKGKTEEE